MLILTFFSLVAAELVDLVSSLLKRAFKYRLYGYSNSVLKHSAVMLRKVNNKYVPL